MNRVLVVATRNDGKVRELQRILGGEGGLQLKSLAAFPEMPEIVEDGDTFEANAKIKALAAARHLGVAACADDSGLTVPALGGEPGVRSARYSGEDATDEQNNSLLLERMKDLEGPEERRGYFVCAAALAVPAEVARDWGVRIPTDWELTQDGVGVWTRLVEVPGVLLHEARGSGGFGYDPLFLDEESNRTYAEMSLAEKNEISHRGRAFRELAREIARLLA